MIPETVRKHLFEKQASLTAEYSRREQSMYDHLNSASEDRLRMHEIRDLIEDYAIALDRGTPTEVLPTTELPLPRELSPRRRRSGR